MDNVRGRVTLIVVFMILIALGVYLAKRSSGNLNVEPHARDEIEKAKQR